MIQPSVHPFALHIGTRRSLLALRQTDDVIAMLQGAFADLEIHTQHIVTSGDTMSAAPGSDHRAVVLPPMGIKGLWTAELEGALEAGVIDLAVHSMKDMPTVLSSRFAIGAVPVRQDPRDVFVSRDGSPFVQLPPGAVVGTSSIRRAVQLRRLRPDIRVETVRGNVDTRLRKLHDPSGPFHGIVLAAAGLARLGLSAQVTHPFEEEELLPAPGQGALAVQCRAEDLRVRELLASIHDRAAGVETTVERAFIDALGASCNTPVGAKATCRGDRVSFVGRWYAVDGSRCIEVRGEAGWDGAEELGRAMAAEAIAEGASPFCAPP